MKDLREAARELERGGQAETIRALAGSAEAQKLGGMLDRKAAERALNSGDTAALQRMLDGLLATEEGRNLIDRLQKLM